MRYPPQHPIGGSFAHVALATSSATTLVAAASNTRGMVIRSFNIQGGGGSVTTAIYVDAAAPTSLNDTAKRRIAAQTGSLDYGRPPLPVFVPAGQGLFGWSNGAGASVSVSYDLL